MYHVVIMTHNSEMPQVNRESSQRTNALAILARIIAKDIRRKSALNSEHPNIVPDREIRDEDLS